jgi:hypothetical protein
MSAGSILLYGESGVGKTVATHRAFKRAIVLKTEEDAHDSVLVDQEREPPSIALPNDFKGGTLFEIVVNSIKKINQEINEGKYSTLVIDSGSDLADRLLMDYSLNVTNNALKLYPAVELQMKQILNLMWGANRWIVMLCHENAPFTSPDGQYYRGCPKFPGRNLPMILHYKFSVVARLIFDPLTNSRAIACKPGDSSWLYKDRFGFLKEEQPLDIIPMVQNILKVKTGKGKEK